MKRFQIMRKAANKALEVVAQVAPVAQNLAECRGCLFGQKQGLPGRRICRRYPQTLIVAEDHWCGEFQPVKP